MTAIGNRPVDENYSHTDYDAAHELVMYLISSTESLLSEIILLDRSIACSDVIIYLGRDIESWISLRMQAGTNLQILRAL